MLSLTQIKSYFWYVFGILGVVFFWTGVWDGVGNLWYFKNPLVSLIVGLVMLTLSGFIFKESSPFAAAEKTVESVLHQVHHHPQREKFHIKYLDKIKGKNLVWKVSRLKSIEKEFLVFLDKGEKEIFVPLHRVREVLKEGKTHWKLK